MQGLTVESLSLSPAEQRAYPRWYTDLLLRKRHDTVAVGDLLRFVDNFGISERDKQRISSFLEQPLVVIEPVQFYIFLRLCGHLLHGQQLRKELAYVSAPVPKPRSILSKRKQEDNNPFSKPPSASDGPGSEMDSFMSLMGGSAPGKRHRKRVTFDDNPPSVAEAAQRSMQELMRQQALAPHPLVSPAPQPPQGQNSYQEPEQDVPIPHNHFSRVNIESVLHDGHSSIPEPPPPRKLTPNTTGPGEMIQMGVIRPGESLSNVLEPQSSENLENWYLQAQGTGNAATAGYTMANTMANASAPPPPSRMQSQSTGGIPSPFQSQQGFPPAQQPQPQPQYPYQSLQVPQTQNSPSPVVSSGVLRPPPAIPQQTGYSQPQYQQFQQYQPPQTTGAQFNSFQNQQWQQQPNPSQNFQTYPQHQQNSASFTSQSLGQQFQNLSLSPMLTGQVPHQYPYQQQAQPQPQQQYQQQYQQQQQYQTYGGVQVPPPPPRRTF